MKAAPSSLLPQLPAPTGGNIWTSRTELSMRKTGTARFGRWEIAGTSSFNFAYYDNPGCGCLLLVLGFQLSEFQLLEIMINILGIRKKIRASIALRAM